MDCRSIAFCRIDTVCNPLMDAAALGSAGEGLPDHARSRPYRSCNFDQDISTFPAHFTIFTPRQTPEACNSCDKPAFRSVIPDCSPSCLIGVGSGPRARRERSSTRRAETGLLPLQDWRRRPHQSSRSTIARPKHSSRQRWPSDPACGENPPRLSGPIVLASGRRSGSTTDAQDDATGSGSCSAD